ncbi:MAG: transposase [Acidimicrobiales bacterium]|nr:transposase [Acidimicrobiales bacterium]
MEHDTDEPNLLATLERSERITVPGTVPYLVLANSFQWVLRNEQDLMTRWFDRALSEEDVNPNARCALMTQVEEVALAGCPEGTRLEVIVEPTGPAWLPIAVFFTSRGHTVFRVSSAKASDLRKFFSRHTKTNGIDADTLARLALVDPAGLQPLQLPGVEHAALDRRVRACDRLTRAAAEHKVRIKDLVRQLLPMTPLTGDLGAADLAVLERWADPTAKAKPCPRPDRRCYAPPSSELPTTPASRTPSSPASTTSRWSNAARTTSAHSASSPPTSPNAPGRS